MFQRFALTALLVFVLSPSSQAREWRDVSGIYSLEADMIGFDDHAVILQRTNGDLGAFPLDKLSKKDHEYLKSAEAKDIHSGNIGEIQTWNLTNGLKVTGRIVDFAKRDVTVQSRRGKTYVNNIMFENLPQIYQYMLPMIVAHLEQTGEIDKLDFKRWVRGLKGQAKTFNLTGVLFELENGDEYGVPFFLFAKQDQQLLKPGWETWIKSHNESVQAAAREAFMLQSAAAAYKQQQDSQQQQQRKDEFYRQIAVMNLRFQAVNAGITSAWEVTLYPLPGNGYRPRWVVAYGVNSLQATQNALRANPGFRDGAVRKLSRR